MATGDQDDIISRIKAVLPRWWAGLGSTPILDAVLAGWGQAYSYIYGLIAYARLQTRINTASDGFLDLIAADFFGPSIVRFTGESDDQFRAFILANIFAERLTRQGITNVMTALTGRAPALFEPWYPPDTGALDMGELALDTFGGLGDYDSVPILYVVAFRPLGQGIPYALGTDVTLCGLDLPTSSGSLELIDPSIIANQVTDAQIEAALQASVAAGVTLVTSISN